MRSGARALLRLTPDRRTLFETRLGYGADDPALTADLEASRPPCARASTAARRALSRGEQPGAATMRNFTRYVLSVNSVNTCLLCARERAGSVFYRAR